MFLEDNGGRFGVLPVDLAVGRGYGSNKSIDVSHERSPLSSHLGHTLLNFFRTQVARVSRDRPVMTKRVLELTISVAPERIRDGHGDLGAGGHGLRDDRLSVVDVQVDGDR